MYCKECGKQIDDNSKFCMFCGASVKKTDVSDDLTTTLADETLGTPILTTKENTTNTSSTNNIKGKNKAIASLVLGIVSVIWSFIALSYIADESNLFISFSELISYFIGFSIISLPSGIVGLCLGISSQNKCGQKIAGIILNSISLFLISITLIIVLSNF